jgi:hypothetical protein
MAVTEAFAAVVLRRLQGIETRAKEHANRTKCPPLAVLTSVFDVLFWASIKTEEGRPIQVRIFYVDPKNPDPDPPPFIRSHRWKTFSLTQRLTFNVNNLVKLAKAADPWTSGLAIFKEGSGELFIWGMVDQVVHLSMALVQEASGYFPPPGAFHAVINGPADVTVAGHDRFIARLAQNETIEELNDCLSEGPISEMILRWVKPVWRDVFNSSPRSALKGLRDDWKSESQSLWAKTLSRILINIKRQRHGGAILFSPSESCEDLSIKYELNYRRVPEAMRVSLFHAISLEHARDKVEELANGGSMSLPGTLYAEEAQHQGGSDDSDHSLTGAVRFISSMAGVDGLILASPDFGIRGFGVEITTKQDLDEIATTTSAQVKHVRLRSANSYGTRHRSMARFCSVHPGSVGFVVSQDGDIRAITKIGRRTTFLRT